MSSMDRKWFRVSYLILTSLLVWLTASSAHAEKPQVRLRPIAPGAIAIDWEHSFDSADSITVEREARQHLDFRSNGQHFHRFGPSA